MGQIHRKQGLLIGILSLCLCALPLFSALTLAQSSREILRLGRGTANTLDWRPDGKVLAVGGGTGIWLYDEQFTTLAHFVESSISAVRWNPDGSKLLVANDAEAQIRSISEDGKSSKVMLSVPCSHVSSIAWRPDGQQFAVASYDGVIQIWNKDTGKLAFELQDATWEVAWNPDGSKLAGISANNYSIHIWNADTGDIIQTLTGVEDYLFWTSLAWSPDGTQLAGVSSLPASLHIWDIQSSKVVNKPDTVEEMYGSRQVIWDSHTNQIIRLDNSVSPPADSVISVWDGNTWENISSNGEWVGKREIALNPTSAVLTSLAWNGVIANWNMPDLETMNVYPFHFPDQSQMSWSPDNNQLATFVSTGEGDPVLIWRLASPDHEKPYHMLVGDVVSGLSWTYVTTLKWVSEHQLVTTSENVPINYIFRSVERWNTESGKSEQVIFRSEGIVVYMGGILILVK